jgi:Uma2 family endonuclease
MAIHPPRKRTLPKPRQPGVSKYHGVRMTEEEYLSLPEEKPYLEYVDGVVLQKPVVNRKHRRIVGRLDALFDAFVRSYGGDYGPEGRVQLRSGGFRLPDTAYWAPGRPTDDDSLPTLAVEVRSPDQTMTELRGKCRQFRTSGVDVCWLIDPEARVAEVFEGPRDAERLPRHGTLESAFLPGFSLPVDELFSVLDRE